MAWGDSNAEVNVSELKDYIAFMEERYTGYVRSEVPENNGQTVYDEPIPADIPWYYLTTPAPEGAKHTIDWLIEAADGSVSSST